MPRKTTVKKPRKQYKAKSYTTLTKRLKKVEAKQKQDTQYLCYGNVSNANLSGPVEVNHLTNSNSWNVIFGTDAQDADCNKVIYKGFGMDVYIQSSNEPANITFTCFLVSLTDLIGSNFNVNTGALTLVNNFHYTVQGSQVLLNKKVFKIHKVKRFTLGNNNQALSTSTAQRQYGTDMRFYWKLKRNQVFQNPYGDWKTVNAQLDPNKNIYMLIFNDNVAADLESPTCQYNIVHTIQKNL